MSLYSLCRHSTKDQCLGGADGLRSEHHNGREDVHLNNECTQREDTRLAFEVDVVAQIETAAGQERPRSASSSELAP